MMPVNKLDLLCVHHRIGSYLNHLDLVPKHWLEVKFTVFWGHQNHLLKYRRCAWQGVERSCPIVRRTSGVAQYIIHLLCCSSWGSGCVLAGWLVALVLTHLCLVFLLTSLSSGGLSPLQCCSICFFSVSSPLHWHKLPWWPQIASDLSLDVPFEFHLQLFIVLWPFT